MEWYKNCSDLPLRIFFEVAETLNYSLLLKKIDGYVDEVILSMVWEDIISDWIAISENTKIQNVIDKTDQQFIQTAKYIEIKAMLLYLVGAYKKEYVDRLAELGYKIDVTDRKSLIESIKLNDNRSNQINTRVKILQKEIEQVTADTKRQTFDGAMAEISTQLKFEPDNNITCARYLMYKKQINERNKKK